MGARKRGGRVMGREGGMEVLSFVYVCVCQGACVCVYLSNSIRGQVDEHEMQEVYR